MRLISKIGKRIRYMLRSFFRFKQVTLHNVKINIDHPNIPRDLRRYFYKGEYEAQEITILDKILNEDDVVMEIGAGIGFLSAYCAKKVGDDQVYSYEANPKMIGKIEETFRLNDVSPHLNNLLLSSSNGEIEFYSENSFWSSSVYKRTDNSELITVKCRNVNEEISKVKPSILVVDIEGGEETLVPLLELSSVRALIIEIHPHIIGDRMASEIVGAIIKKGFCINMHKTEGIVYLFEKCEEKLLKNIKNDRL